jgi:hypothetical protein
MKKTKFKEVVIQTAAGITIAVAIGNIVPMNLLSGSTDFSPQQVNEECCGPYSQCQCTDMTGTN